MRWNCFKRISHGVFTTTIQPIEFGVLALMEESLQRLLDAETKAQQIHKKADEQRERMIQEALQEAKAKEARFELRIPELHHSFMEKAEARAEQTIAELKKRFNERHAQLRDYAEAREHDALEAAFEVLIDPTADED
jgi:vacuolar-type H+-ATPase subunit H